MLATVLAAVLTAGPSPPPKPTATPSPPPVIEGTVRGPSGAPLKDALVTGRLRNADLSSRIEPPLTGRTDAEGRFRLSLKKPALVDVRVEVAGMSPKTVEGASPGKRLEIKLEGGKIIEGTVRDAGSGKPIPGARVQSFTRRRARADEPYEGLREAVADANGRYKLEGLGAGPVALVASARAHRRVGRESVRPGTRLDLLLLPGSSILGMVRGPDGKGLAGAQVAAESQRVFPEVETTRSDGSFEMAGLAPGAYRMWAHRSGIGTSVIEETELQRDSDTRVALHVQAGVAVEGRLVTAAEKPVIGAISILELDGTRSALLGNVLRVASAADGRFRLSDMPPGDHVLAVQAEGFAPKRVDLMVPAAPTEPVDLGAIEMDRGLTIQGRVVDKDRHPVSGARLVAWLETSNTEATPEAGSEADGGFVLAGLEPGAYSVGVTADGYGGQIRPVEAGADKVLFMLQPAGTITGQVVDERGSPVPAFRVAAQLQPDKMGTAVYGSGGKSVESDDGRFALEDVAEGTYRVEASAETKRPGLVKDVVVRRGATTDAGRIRLEAGGTIRGVVVDTRGAPIASATVSASDGGRRRPAQGDASTGMDGSFEIEGAPVGTVEVTASHPDYATSKSEPVTVDPAQGPATVRVVLSDGGRVAGHARRRDGSGVPGARFQVGRIEQGWRQNRSLMEAPVSPGDGSFAVEHVPAGLNRVQLLMDDGRGGSDLSRTQQVTVVDGETMTVEMVVREVLVSGRVTRSGEPVPGVRVTLGYDSWLGTTGPLASTPTGPLHGIAVTDPDGAYELIANEPGPTELSVESLDRRTTHVQRSVDIPDSDGYTLDVALSGAPVSGTVVDRESGEAISRAELLGKPHVGESGFSGSTGADGRFSLEAEPGDYELSADAAGYAKGSVPLSVTAEGASDVRVALSRGARIEGKVVDAAGRGVAGLPVQGTSGDPTQEGTSHGFAITQADGSFDMGGLLDRPHNLLTGTALAGFAMQPSVAAGSKDVVLTLVPAGRLHVLVTGANGAPVDRASLFVTRMAGVFVSVMGSAQSFTGPEGIADMKVPQGPIEVTVGKVNVKTTSSVDVPAEGVASLQVALPVH